MPRPIKYRPRARDLTPERMEVFRALSRYWDQHGYSPSLRELARELSLRSPSTVWNHLECLERYGLVHRKPNAPRGWRLAA